jgi:hypothetical protein
MGGIGSAGAKLSEATIAALVAHAVDEIFKASFSQTDAMLKEVYQKSNGIYDNLKKHMGEEFDDKSYPYPKTVMQVIGKFMLERGEASIGSEFVEPEIRRGEIAGKEYYEQNKEKFSDEDVDTIIRRVPEHILKDRELYYAGGFSLGIRRAYEKEKKGEEREKRKFEKQKKGEEEERKKEEERTINEEKEKLKNEESKYAKDLFEIEFNKEALESLLNAKDEKSLKALEIDEEGLKGQIEAMDYIQKNILHYFESDPEPLFKDANERIKDMSESYKENYLKIFERYRTPENFRDSMSGIDSTGIEAEAVSSLMNFHKQLEENDIEGATVALASFTKNIEKLAEPLTGESAEEIKTAVSQFGEFSGRMMNVLTAGDISGKPTLASSPEKGLVVPAVFTEDHAKLIAKEVVAQLAGEVTTKVSEKDTGVVSNNEVAIALTPQNEEVAKMATIMKDGVANMSTLSISNFEAMAAFFGSFTDISGKLIIAIEAHQKIIEPTSAVKAGNKISEGDMFAESITSSIKQLERTYVKRIDRFEDNFVKQFLDLINLIKRSSLTFKDIYEMLCKRMEHDLKYGR